MRMSILLVGLLVVGSITGCRSGGGASGGTAVDIGRIAFQLPAGWEKTTPTSTMRAAQATIPGPGGPAELAVFHFGAGQGGDIETNLQRWLSQIQSAPEAAPERGTFENNGLRITWVDASGTLQPGQMGMGPSSPQPNSRLLGGIIEGDGGPWFFKATGPETTLTPQREAFLAMLRSATPKQ